MEIPLSNAGMLLSVVALTEIVCSDTIACLNATD